MATHRALFACASGAQPTTDMNLPFMRSCMAALALLLGGCTASDGVTEPLVDPTEDVVTCDLAAPAITSILNLPLTPYNYANQGVPPYINRDNSGANPITDAGATLGRVLFYDTRLSSDNTVSCASCHRQALAFGDAGLQSDGVNGVSARHSMRLVNARFSEEAAFFWDERAGSLEDQHSTVIRDHVEMGNSGAGGDPSVTDLVAELQAQAYYQNLFTCAFGDATVSEDRVRLALAQFVRGIQSFDSRYDQGRALARNDGEDFTGFTAEENLGKRLFLQRPIFDGAGVRVDGGAGCQGCHRAPEFDIDPGSGNNGVVTRIGDATPDFTVTRSPSLRDVVQADGTLNGPTMHVGLGDLDAMLDHYDAITLAAGNTNLDPRLRPAGRAQQLRLTPVERNALKAFLRTLAGTDVYTNVKWSNPFR